LTDIFYTDPAKGSAQDRDFVLIGKERHDVGRPGDVGYPIRGIIKEGFLYVKNFKPDRWPAGNPETGYLNVDGSPTKSVILHDRRLKGTSRYWDLNFGKRKEEELYYIIEDPWCTENIAGNPEYADIKQELWDELQMKLKEQGDPRIIGNADIFDEYLYSNESERNFYERYMSGEDAKAGWVNPDDFEKEKLD
jgi:hypothetical protein